MSSPCSVLWTAVQQCKGRSKSFQFLWSVQQVMYEDDHSGRLILYIVAATPEKRELWIQELRKGALTDLSGSPRFRKGFTNCSSVCVLDISEMPPWQQKRVPRACTYCGERTVPPFSETKSAKSTNTWAGTKSTGHRLPIFILVSCHSLREMWRKLGRAVSSGGVDKWSVHVLRTTRQAGSWLPAGFQSKTWEFHSW